MASKESWSTRIRHDSDATFQEWRDEAITKLGLMVAAGHLAADETNITPGAGARPGTNTEQGYAVYHLNDAMHATAPVYIRFAFRTENGTTTPGIRVQVGTSTNGSGVLGGTALSQSTRTMHSPNTGAQITDTARDSWMCCRPGVFWWSNKSGSSNFDGFFAVCRTVDADGDPDARGVIIVWGNSTGSNNQTQALQFPSAFAWTVQSTLGLTALAINPQMSTASTLVSGDTQAYLGWTICPEVAPVVGVIGVIGNELAANNTFTVTPVGSTARTYISLKAEAGPFGAVAPTTSGGLRYCGIWE
jgi:hypothetical protein